MELENAEGHENETVQCGGPANEAGHYAPPPPPPPPLGFLCCVRTVYNMNVKLPDFWYTHMG